MVLVQLPFITMKGILEFDFFFLALLHQYPQALGSCSAFHTLAFLAISGLGSNKMSWHLDLGIRQCC